MTSSLERLGVYCGLKSIFVLLLLSQETLIHSVICSAPQSLGLSGDHLDPCFQLPLSRLQFKIPYTSCHGQETPGPEPRGRSPICVGDALSKEPVSQELFVSL